MVNTLAFELLSGNIGNNLRKELVSDEDNSSLIGATKGSGSLKLYTIEGNSSQKT